MKCPLRSAITHYPLEEVGIDTFDCLEEECAWWNDTVKACSITQIGVSLMAINAHLRDIASKTPLGGKGCYS